MTEEIKRKVGRPKTKEIKHIRDKMGRPKNEESEKNKWRLTYLNPQNNLPINIEEYNSINQIAKKLGISTIVAYSIQYGKKKSYRFYKIEKII